MNLQNSFAEHCGKKRYKGTVTFGRDIEVTVPFFVLPKHTPKLNNMRKLTHQTNHILTATALNQKLRYLFNLSYQNKML